MSPRNFYRLLADAWCQTFTITVLTVTVLVAATAGAIISWILLNARIV